MVKRWFPVLALVCLAAPLASVPAAAAETNKPIFVFRVRSLDALFADGRFLGDLAGGKEIARQVGQMIQARMGEKGLEGIDTKRPWGTYAHQVNIPVVMVPIKDEKVFLNFLQTLNVDAKKGKDGLYSAKLDFLPAEPVVYFRFAQNYAYITLFNADAVARDGVLDPGLLKLTSPKTLASGTLHIDRLPPEIKDLVIGRIKDGLQKAEAQKPPRENPDQKKFRLQFVRDGAAALIAIVNDGSEAALTLDVDRQGNHVTLEGALRARSDSKLAQNIAALGGEVSMFAHLVGGAPAAGGLVHFSLPRNLRTVLGPIIDNGMKQTLEKEADEGKRALASQFFKAVRPTLEAGELDLMGTLRGPSKAGLYTAILGVKLREGQDIEKVVQEVIKKVSPRTEQLKFKLNADKAGGVDIHQVNIADDIDLGVRKLYGDAPAFFAFRKDALFITLGEGSLPAIKEAIAARPEAGPVFALEVSLAQLVPLIKQGKNKEAARVAEETFGGSNKDPGRIRFVLEGGKALKVRVSATGAVVKFLSKLATYRFAQAPAPE